MEGAFGATRWLPRREAATAQTVQIQKTNLNVFAEAGRESRHDVMTHIALDRTSSIIDDHRFRATRTLFLREITR